MLCEQDCKIEEIPGSNSNDFWLKFRTVFDSKIVQL